MQQWFFLEDPENAKRRAASGDVADSKQIDISSLYPPRQWHFRVRVPEIRDGDTVVVTGSVPALGTWIPEKSIALHREENTEIWSVAIDIPDKCEVRYRYAVCVIVQSGLQSIVRNWETNLHPRIIGVDAKSPSKKDEPQSYGDYGNSCTIERGWLNKETTVQLKLFRNPVTLWRWRYEGRTIFIKVTPFNLLRYNTNFPKSMSEALEESLSTETQDVLEHSAHSCTEVLNLTANESSFEPQGQFGKEYNEGDVLIFQSSVRFPDNTAFLIDVFVYSSKAVLGDPPYHAGFSYLLPSVLHNSEGTTVLPLTSIKHRPLGQIQIDYLVIRPMSNFKCDMSVSFARHWKQTWNGLDVGHRGSGSSFKGEPKNCAEVRENTIASLKTAAEHGADFVEFDVQLSKDLVPIVYHDYHVCISMKRKKLVEEFDMLEVPIKDLTLEQLHLLKVYHLTEGKSKSPRFYDEDLEEHQPFPTLQQVLEVLDVNVGFNIEIKWNNQLIDGSYETNHPFDLNMFLDTILEVVLSHGCQRRIIFSCFNADICTMLRLKQNKYPVMYLTQGQTAKYQHYMDPRAKTIKSAVQLASVLGILGVCVHTEDILRDCSQVRMATSAGLVIFCWGDENADPDTIKYLKEIGLHGIIYDKIYQYSCKEVKESIFLIEARESQKDLIRLAAANAEMPQPPSPAAPKERILDVEKARPSTGALSTATSLESLESRRSDCKCRETDSSKQ